MTVEQIIGYLSSILLVSTFYMKTMIPLRITAVLANASMITWAGLSAEWTIFAIQGVVLPLNVLRLLQVRKAIRRARSATLGDLNVDAIARYSRLEHFSNGTRLFDAGDVADRVYIIKAGRVRLDGIDVELGEGDIFGEIGILTAAGRRTAGASCVTDADLLALTRDDVAQMYYLDPSFGWHIIRLATERLLTNLESSRPEHTT